MHMKTEIVLYKKDLCFFNSAIRKVYKINSSQIKGLSI